MTRFTNSNYVRLVVTMRVRNSLHATHGILQNAPYIVVIICCHSCIAVILRVSPEKMSRWTKELFLGVLMQ
jgi:hypothetical protein